MKQALRELKRQKQQLEIPYRVEFCFGCFEVPPGHDFTLSAVLSKADEEMYERKKQFHIREAQRRLMEPAASGVQTDLFSGDTMRLYKAPSKSTDAYICQKTPEHFQNENAPERWRNDIEIFI